MARTSAKAQRLESSIQRAADKAGSPITINPETVTLQQVEALADSLQVTPESLLIPEAA